MNKIYIKLLLILAFFTCLKTLAMSESESEEVEVLITKDSKLYELFKDGNVVLDSNDSPHCNPYYNEIIEDLFTKDNNRLSAKIELQARLIFHAQQYYKTNFNLPCPEDFKKCLKDKVNCIFDNLDSIFLIGNKIQNQPNNNNHVQNNSNCCCCCIIL